MLKKVINRISRAKSTAPVRRLVDKSADTAKKISQSSFVGRATGFLDEALLGQEATKLISMQNAVASRLKKAAIPQIHETYARKVGTGISNAMLRGAGTGAVVGGIYGAFDDDTSILQGATKGAMMGAGAGLLYSGYRSRHLLSKLAEHGDDWIVPRSMFSYSKLPSPREATEQVAKASTAPTDVKMERFRKRKNRDPKTDDRLLQEFFDEVRRLYNV